MWAGQRGGYVEDLSHFRPGKPNTFSFMHPWAAITEMNEAPPHTLFRFPLMQPWFSFYRSLWVQLPWWGTEAANQSSTLTSGRTSTNLSSSVTHLSSFAPPTLSVCLFQGFRELWSLQGLMGKKGGGHRDRALSVRSSDTLLIPLIQTHYNLITITWLL